LFLTLAFFRERRPLEPRQSEHQAGVAYGLQVVSASLNNMDKPTILVHAVMN
jgi:hypothetical protein